MIPRFSNRLDLLSDFLTLFFSSFLDLFDLVKFSVDALNKDVELLGEAFTLLTDRPARPSFDFLFLVVRGDAGIRLLMSIRLTGEEITGRSDLG